LCTVFAVLAELKVGDSVKLFDGSNLVIEQITVVPGRTTVYNFEVEDYHTYYVSDAKVLVHNIGVCDNVLPPKKIVKEGEVSVLHYYRSGDHAPAQLHVKGGVAETRIGQNGKPLAGHSELTSIQKLVVESNKAIIRSSVKKIMKFHKATN
jgi:hypothetical protein